MSSPGAPLPPNNPPRSWRACESCRKKKIKCDGIVPCNPCGSRGLSCVYPDANDNAARSRQDTTYLNAHYDKLDVLHERMEQMMMRLSTAVEALEKRPGAANHTRHSVNPSMSRNPSLSDQEMSTASSLAESERNSPSKSLAELGNLVPDASNIYRYIGGAGNALAVDIIQNFGASETTPGIDQVSPSKLTSSLYGTSDARPLNLLGGRGCQPPPRYMSDILVGLFFTRLNPTFPILHEGTFSEQHKEFLARSSADQGPSPFRSVLFAVYACASSMLVVPRQNQEHQNGIEYLDRALLDHYQHFGYGGLEEVQCLAILAMCMAGWNRIMEGWKLAGQAVRAAQDLGLHINFPVNSQDQTRSRVWWCVYTIDSLLSACIGRPTLAIDTDHDCELPETVDDTPTPTDHSGPSGEGDATMRGSPSIAGFVALCQACRILDRINRSTKALISENQDHNSHEDGWAGGYQVVVLETQLSEWVQEKLPPAVKFAANKVEEHGGVNMSMCTITFMLHAVAVINLNLPLIDVWEIDPTMLENQEVGTGGSVCKVITAARGIIQVSELVSSNIPPSHYLAFCVHLVYLSGFILLKVFQISHNPKAVEEVRTCVARLAELGAVYPGSAERSEVLGWLLHNVQAW